MLVTKKIYIEQTLGPQDVHYCAKNPKLQGNPLCYSFVHFGLSSSWFLIASAQKTGSDTTVVELFPKRLSYFVRTIPL